MDAIRWEGNTLYLLDQTKLPVTEVWLPYTDYRPVADAIRTMVVRGAPAIGVAAAYAYCLAALAGEGLDEAKETLAASRPTAVNLFWALERMERKAKECGGAAEPLIAEAKAIHAEDVAMCRAMGAHGAAVVLLESECSGEKLYETVRDMLSDPERRKAMSRAMAGLSVDNANEKIFEVLRGLASGEG